VALLGSLVVLSLPWPRAAWATLPKPDPRNQAANFVVRHSERKSVVLVERSVGLDPRTLADRTVLPLPSPGTPEFKAWARWRPRGPGIAIVSADSSNAYARVLRSRRAKRQFDRRLRGPQGPIEKTTALCVLQF
jgi:hypothetical protein